MPERNPDLLALDGCLVDLVTGGVADRGGRVARAPLTAIERRALDYLVRHRDRVVSRDELLVEVWGYRGHIITRTVDVTIARIRAKVENDPRRPNHIHTVHGEGYRFTGAVAAAADGRPAPETPAELTPLLGRDADVAALLERLARGARLVTVTGPGGIGKSRLAIRVARALGRRVVWAELGDARSPEAALSAVATPLGVPLPGATLEAAIDRVARALGAGEPPLLVLDDAEGVADALREPVAAWLAHSEATLVVTSRVLLRVAGEHAHRLGPLETADAVALFQERRRALHGHANEDLAIPELVAALDGNPLAIELAAARSGVLSPKELLRRLDERLHLLAAAPGQVQHRHASLRAVIEESWALLSEAERRVATRCAVFAGGFDLDAVDGVLGEPALDRVEALVDRSLLRAFDAPRPPGGLRLRMDESVRAYAREHLDPIAAETRAAHARWYAAAGFERLERLRGPEARAALAWLHLERENLLAALRATEEPDVALRLGLVWHALGTARGPLPVRDEALRLAVDKGRAGDPVLRARLAAARIEPMRSLRDANELAAEIARARALAAGHADVLALLDLTEAELAYRTGDVARALELARAAADGLRGGRRTDALVMVGRAAHRLGEVDAARRAYDEALVVATRGEDVQGEAQTRLFAAFVDERVGHKELAAERLERARERFGVAGDAAGEAWAAVCLAGVRLDLGQGEAARALLDRAQRLARSVGDLYGEGTALTNLGNARLVDGDRAGAAEAFREAIAVLHRQGSPADELVSQANLGIVERDLGLLEQVAARCEAQGLDVLATLTLAWIAALRASRDELDAAGTALERARALADASTADVVAVLAGVVDLGRARAAPEPERRALVARAREALPEGGSTDARIAAAFLRELLEARETPGARDRG